MTEFDKTIDAYVRKNPLVFLGMANDEVVLLKASEAVKLSVGFEIECSSKKDIDIAQVTKEFKNIPYILDADANEYSEQRFRIPTGINGLLCLYFITTKLKKYYELNLGSGIHYHIDLQSSENREKVDDLLFYTTYDSRWILEELDKWNYQGTYNKRNISCSKGNWFVVRSRTIEIRIGEMTFDYELLVERIIHCNKIVEKVMLDANCTINNDWSANNTSINTKLILDYLKYKDDSLLRKLNEITEKLAKLKEKYHIVDDNKLDRRLIENYVNNRIIKI